MRESTPTDAASWGNQLILLEQTNAIVTPVYLEFIAGARSRHELQLTEAYLQTFECVDGGQVLEEDWEEALRLARWIPANSKPRQLGDCLIKAIARRLRYTVRTFDLGFPR